MSWITLAAALSASAVGVLTEVGYHADQATESMLRGFDLTTLVVVVPFLLLQGHRGILALLQPGLLAYLIYSYLFAAVTGGFGAAFLMDVAIACSAAFALANVLMTPRRPLVDQLSHTGRRISAVLLSLLALSLGGMWVGASIVAAVSNDTPTGSGLVETELAVRLGMTLDLVLLVPLYVLAAVLLWRGQQWGHTLGLIAAVSGLLHQVSYLTAMLYQSRADVPGAQAFDPLEPVIIACYTVILLALMRSQPAAVDEAQWAERRENDRAK